LRRTSLILAGLVAGAVLTVTAAASKHAAATVSGTVSAVPSGDSLVVSYRTTAKKGKKKVTVTKRVTAHVLGVVAPAGNSCFAPQSTDALSKLVLGKRVIVSGSLSGATVALDGTPDLATALLQRGAVQVDVARGAFTQLGTYAGLQQAAERASAGMWGACAADIGVSVKGADKAFAGDYVNYTVTVQNNGPMAAPQVNVELRPGNYAKLISSVSSPNAACASKLWVGYCTVTNLGVGSSVAISLVIRPSQPGGLSARAVATLVACTQAQCERPLQDPNLLNDRAAQPTIVPGGSYGLPGQECDKSYPGVCIPPSPPDLDCADIAPLREFRVDYTVAKADEHHLDGDHNGIACQGDDY
jgi:endonuclease YncB( thermonuclease family)